MARELQRRGHRQGLRTTGFLWGRRRVRLDLSMRDLARLSGIHYGDLSKFENGRMIPTIEEYDRVTAALEGVELELAGSGSSPQNMEPASSST